MGKMRFGLPSQGSDHAYSPKNRDICDTHEAFCVFGIGIGDGDKLDTFEATILRGMMTSERTGADYGSL